MAQTPPPPSDAGRDAPTATVGGVTLRFAGDAGDGMFLAGLRFAAASAQAGNDVHLVPIPPSEIRAPAGAVTAVSAFQVHFSSRPLFTPGDRLDALVAMNPAALKLHRPDLKPGGLLIVNSDAFEPADLERARCTTNPLHDGSLAAYRVVAVPMQRLNRDAVAPVKLLAPREIDRSRNIFALGLVCWLFDRPLEPTLRWIRGKFSRNPLAVDANARALQAGYDYGRSLGGAVSRSAVASSARPPGTYRRVSGNEALGLGLAAAANRLGKRLVFASYPLVPACEMQQQLRDLEACGVRALDAEDEMAAAGMAVGAAFAGGIGVAITSGPGLCLMGETLGLAVVAELPLVVVDVMRAGPGNGIPTASDQGDLFQAIYGRNGDSPLVVLAPTSPADGFRTALLAVRLAVEAMTPVVVLTDVPFGLASEIWRVPALADLPRFEAPHGVVPFARDGRGVPTWVIPGTPGGEHRQTGLEKDAATGRASLDPLNHERMVAQRIEKIDRLADAVPPAEIVGPESGDVLVVGWGSASGAIRAAVGECRARGAGVSAAILTSLHPLPRNLGPLLSRFRRVVVAELNAGQLRTILRARFGVEATGCNKIQGRPFEVADIVAAVAD